MFFLIGPFCTYHSICLNALGIEAQVRLLPRFISDLFLIIEFNLCLQRFFLINSCNPSWVSKLLKLVLFRLTQKKTIFLAKPISIKGIKNTHREKALSNKTLAFTKNWNFGNWVVGTSNQLSLRGS